MGEWAMRYFLYTYELPENYRISRRLGVFGAPKHGGDHLSTKIERLREGDLIIIRDATYEKLSFLGYCVVTGPLYDQEKGGTPWPDLIWHDEQSAKQIKYPLRCAVNFSSAPQLSLSGITWDDLDALQFVNHRGKRIRGAQAWGKKLSGNFVEKPKELEQFNSLVQLESE